MKIAYVTMFDATDVRNWSGTDLHIWKALQKQGIEVELIGNLRHGPSLRRKLRKLWGQYMQRKGFLHFWNLQTARAFASDVADRLGGLAGVDCVLSPTPIPLAFLECQQPKVLWTDAIFSGLSQCHEEFNPRLLCAATVSDAWSIEREICRNCDRLVFTSQWAAGQAVAAGAPVEKVAVVPFGANIEVCHNESDVAAWARRRGSGPVRLLFVGVDWIRKGAPKAIEVVGCLRQRGADARLTIVGCTHPPGESLPDFVNCIGFISKGTVEGRDRISALYRESHFLVVPTLAEAFGLVFAEASAFGVPSLSHRVGGVTTIVHDDVNGKLFCMEEPTSAWADWVLEQLAIPDRMEKLAGSSYQRYAARLNWDVAGRTVAKMLAELVGGDSAGSGGGGHAGAAAQDAGGTAGEFAVKHG